MVYGMTKKRLLQNNIMLLTEPVAGVKTAAIGFWFSIGSRREQPGEFGITHFTEHLLFKGTATKNTHDIACTFDRIGGYVNAFTEREDVCVYCIIPAQKAAVQSALRTLCDMAYGAVFPPDEFERERAVVQNEIAASADDPESSALDAVALAVWPGQDISRSITGTVRDVAALTREQVAAWYREYFVRGELTVAAAGGITEEELAVELELMPARVPPVCYPAARHYDGTSRWQPGTSFFSSRFRQMQVFELYPVAVPVSERDSYVMAVFNALVGDTMSSRLFESLREKHGCCYTVFSFFTFYEDAAVWCAYASCDKERLAELCALLSQEIRLLESDGITENEIEAAKEHLCGEELMSGEDMEYLMKRLQRNYSMGFPLRGTDEIIAAIRSVSREELAALARRLLAQKDRAFVVYGAHLPARTKKAVLAAQGVSQKKC